MVWIKRIFTLFAIGMLLYLFWPLIGEIRASLDLILHARWQWLLLALVLQFFSYSSLAALNYLLLQSFQGEISFWRVLVILPTIAFIEVAVPSAGASGVVLRARYLGRSGYSAEVSTFTTILEEIYLAVALVCISFSGFWYLFRQGDLGQIQTAVLIGLSVIVLALGVFSVWALRDRNRARRVVLVLSTRWNRLAPKIHQKIYTSDEVSARVDVFYNDLGRLRHRSPLPFLLFSFSRVILDVATLGICFIVFSYPIQLGVLVTGYGLVLALSGLGAIPGGLGLAEASAAVIYARLGAPGAVAIAAALVFRLITFWLIRFVGFINWQILEAQA
jgi:uncharacterized protein (TIRG00374 family)